MQKSDPANRPRIVASRSRLRFTSARLREQALDVEREGDHGDAPTFLRTRPFLLRAVAIELDAILVGIAEIDRLADAVVARTVERDAGVQNGAHRLRQGPAIRIADRDVEESGRPTRRRRATFRFPRVQS